MDSFPEQPDPYFIDDSLNEKPFFFSVRNITFTSLVEL